jgi:hypothetical protein
LAATTERQLNPGIWQRRTTVEGRTDAAATVGDEACGGAIDASRSGLEVKKQQIGGLNVQQARSFGLSLMFPLFILFIVDTLHILGHCVDMFGVQTEREGARYHIVMFMV